MKSILNLIATNLYIILGSAGGFYFAFHFGVAGREKRVSLVPRLIIAVAVVVLAVTLYFLIPGINDMISKNINTSIQKNIAFYTIFMLIANAGLALYLLLVDIIKKSKTLTSPLRRVVNFILSLCLVLYAASGFLPFIPGEFKETFRRSHFIIFLSVIMCLIVYGVWTFVKAKMSRNKIFISYRRKDSADVTGRIVDRLIDKFGSNNILRDVDSIPLGVNFADYIDRLLQSTSVCLVVIGKKWLGLCNSKSDKTDTDLIDYVQIEIETALMQRLPIIPVLLQNAAVPAKNQLPKSINKLSLQNGIAIRPDPDFNLDMERLFLGIKDGIRKMKKMRRTYEYKKMMKERAQAKSGRRNRRKSKKK